MALDERQQTAESAALVDDDTAGSIGIRHVCVGHNVRRRGVQRHVIQDLVWLAACHRLRMGDHCEQEFGMRMVGSRSTI